MSYPPPYPPPPWGPPGYGPPAWSHGPVAQPPGVPFPPRSRRRTVAWVIGGVVAAAAVLTLVVLAGLRVGRDGAPAIAAGAGAGAGLTSVSTAPPSEWRELGDDEGLDSYAERCHDGDMQACDDLYGLSDVMSRYEQYGLTCGGRVKAASLLSCTQLDDD
jgi:hypothetical protein